MKEPWISLILTFSIPGLGHYYIGYKRIGIAIFFSYICSLTFGAIQMLSLNGNVALGWICILISLVLWAVAIISAFKNTIQSNSKEFEKERKTKKNPYIAALLSILLPGSGHFYGRNYFWGIFIFTSFAVFWFFAKQYLPSHSSIILKGLIAISAATMMRSGRKAATREVALVMGIFCIFSIVGSTIKGKLSYDMQIILGPSMWPTIADHDGVLVDVSNNWQLRRGDIVLFYSTIDNRIWCKRIIAFEGEKIEIKNGGAYINGNRLVNTPFDHIYFQTDSGCVFALREHPFLVPQDSIFVLGDNANNSRDSRIDGPINKSDITGVITKIILPPSRFHNFYSKK